MKATKDLCKSTAETVKAVQKLITDVEANETEIEGYFEAYVVVVRQIIALEAQAGVGKKNTAKGTKPAKLKRGQDPEAEHKNLDKTAKAMKDDYNKRFKKIANDKGQEITTKTRVPPPKW